MKLTFPHIVGYITAALSWLAALNPVLISAVAGPKVGALAAPIVALAGAGLIFIHDVTPVKASVTTVAKVLALALVVPLMLTLGACAGLSTLLAPSALPLEQAAVGAAVYTTVVANHADATEQAARAAKINQIAKQVLALDTGANMALADIEIIVNSKVAQLNLPAPELLVAQLLTASLGQAIQAQLTLTTRGAISPDTQVAIAAVCKWVIADTGG